MSKEIDYTNEINEFKYLLKEKEIGYLSQWENELPKLIYDQRYSNLPNELRLTTFNEYIKQIGINGSCKTEQSVSRKTGQENFKLLIKKSIEAGFVNLNTPFAEFQNKYEDDPLFKFTLPIDREFLFNEAKLKLKKILEERKSKNIETFKDMLRRIIIIDIVNEYTTHKDIKKLIKNRPEYKIIASSSERKELIKSFLDDLKKLKAYSNFRNLNDPQNKIKIESEIAKEEFLSLLKEKIKTEISWEEALRKFSTDSRWNSKNINEEEKIETFKNFIFAMRENRKKAYRKLLEEKVGLNQEINWHEAQHTLQKDERFKEVSQSDRELLFQEYMAFIKEQIVAEYTAFIYETNLIDKDSPIDGLPYMELLSKLNSDYRCQRMYKQPDKRDKLLKSRIKQLKFLHEKMLREERKKQQSNRYVREEDSSKWEKGHIIK